MTSSDIVIYTTSMVVNQIKDKMRSAPEQWRQFDFTGVNSGILKLRPDPSGPSWPTNTADIAPT